LVPAPHVNAPLLLPLLAPLLAPLLLPLEELGSPPLEASAPVAPEGGSLKSPQAAATPIATDAKRKVDPYGERGVVMVFTPI
jgi:hypothetical protein